MTPELKTAIVSPEKLSTLENALIDMYVAWNSQDEIFTDENYRSSMGLHFKEIRELLLAAGAERTIIDTIKNPNIHSNKN